MSARKVVLLSDSKGRIVFFMFHLAASPGPASLGRTAEGGCSHLVCGS